MSELSLELVGTRLRRARTQLELTREQFAEQVGISPQFLAEIENGKKGMSADTLYKICTRFDLSSDYLLLGKTTPTQLSDPIQKTLSSFPEPYLALTEELIKAIEKTLPSWKYARISNSGCDTNIKNNKFFLIYFILFNSFPRKPCTHFRPSVILIYINYEE